MRELILSITLSSVVACVAGTSEPAGSAGGKADAISGNGCTRPRMYLMGTPRNFGVAPGGPLQMTCTNGVWQVDELFAGTGNVFGAGAFKFHDTGNWSDTSATNWGDYKPYDGIADAFGDGNDISIDQQGWYRIQFNDRTLEYTVARLPSSCTSASMFVRGTFNNWGTQPMFCVGQNQWAAIPMLINSGEQLKLDTGNWSTNWGDNNADGIAERDGANIVFNDPGRYLLVFHEDTGAYNARLVSASCAWPSMYYRASANNWSGVAMECENGHYALNIDGPTQYKFDAFDDWSLNWGDNNGDMHTEQNGANITVNGHHHLHFYNDATYTYDVH